MTNIDKTDLLNEKDEEKLGKEFIENIKRQL